MLEPLDSFHLDRNRAESFGAVAEQYERFRPVYPAELIADLQATGARNVLDIGCGTGRAGRELAARGLLALGVEPDPDMSAVARANGLDVEVSTFEAWSSGGRSFDLVTCAQAWHWIEPVTGARKVASLLNPRGKLVCFWNYERPHPVHKALAEVYLRLAPECDAASGVLESNDEPYVDDLRRSGVFRSVQVRRYDWTEVITADEWVGRVATQSDHLRLSTTRRTELLNEVHAIVAALEPLTLPSGTYAVFAEVTR